MREGDQVFRYFGSARNGFFLAEDSMRISLTDCWFNPCDPYVALQAQFSTDLSAADLPVGAWHTLQMDYDKEWLDISCDGKPVTRLHAKKDSPLGLSYLHIQCRSDAPSSRGTYIRSLDKRGLEDIPDPDSEGKEPVVTDLAVTEHYSRAQAHG